LNRIDPVAVVEGLTSLAHHGGSSLEGCCIAFSRIAISVCYV